MAFAIIVKISNHMAYNIKERGGAPSPTANEATGWVSFQEKISTFPLQSQHDIEFAYNVARAAHRGQTRKTGEPYFTHPRATAMILLDVGASDPRIIIAALLHDVPEDTTYLSRAPAPTFSRITADMERLKGALGADIADMVETLTELDKEALGVDKREARTLYFQGLRAAPSQVILVKMADRLHNLRTLGAMPVEKQRRKILETKKVYLPIFRRAARDYPQEGGMLLDQIASTISTLESGFPEISSHKARRHPKEVYRRR